MLSSETISCILEGIYIESGCSREDMLKEATTFFDIYEKEVHNKIVNDPDYIKIMSTNKKLIQEESRELQEAKLCWWIENENDLSVVYLDILKDNKNRMLINPLGVLDNYPYNRFDAFKALKKAMPKTYKKLIKQGKIIIKLQGKRNEIYSDLKWELEKSYLSLNLLKTESPEIYKLYEKGREYKKR